MAKQIEKKDFTSSSRLKRLEKEMAFKVAESKTKMSVEALKSKFDYRASLSTTKAIVKYSSLIKTNDDDKLILNLEDDGPRAIVKYKTTGSINNLRIDGQSGDTPEDTIFNVVVNPADLFQLQIDADYGRNWTFKTTSVLITENGFDRKRDNETIDDGEGPYDGWV